jgi:hypothetical protein
MIPSRNDIRDVFRLSKEIKRDKIKKELEVASKALLKLLKDEANKGLGLSIPSGNTPSMFIGNMHKLDDYVDVAKSNEMMPHFKIFEESSDKDGKTNGRYYFDEGVPMTGKPDEIKEMRGFVTFCDGKVHLCLNSEDKELFSDIEDVEMEEEKGGVQLIG